MEQAIMFFWGALGCLAANLLDAHREFHRQNAREILPSRYKKTSYLIGVFILAIIAGCLVIAYEIKNNPLVAFQIGASVPLIFNKFKTPPDGIPQNRNDDF